MNKPATIYEKRVISKTIKKEGNNMNNNTTSTNTTTTQTKIIKAENYSTDNDNRKEINIIKNKIF